MSEPPTGYCATQLTAAADAHADPLRGLRAALETAATNADIMVLAVRLAIEAGREVHDVFSQSQLDAMEGPISDVLLRCVPALGPRARDFAHTLVSLVVTAGAARVPLTPEDLWRQVRLVVRAYLLDAGVAEDRLCEVFGG